MQMYTYIWEVVTTATHFHQNQFKGINNPASFICTSIVLYAHINIMLSIKCSWESQSFFFSTWCVTSEPTLSRKKIVQITSTSGDRYIALSDPISVATCVVEAFNASRLAPYTAVSSIACSSSIYGNTALPRCVLIRIDVRYLEAKHLWENSKGVYL